MGLKTIQEAITSRAPETEQESSTWSVNVRFDMTDTRHVEIAGKLKSLMRQSGFAGGPLVLELLEEILNQVEIPIEEKE
jgi:hypothetical protein